MRRTSLVVTTLAAAGMSLAFASTALACGASQQSMSRPSANTTASTSAPTQQHQQAPGTNG